MSEETTFREDGHKAVDWAADYLERVSELPVLAQVRPGEIRARLPQSPPEQSEPFEAVLRDLDDILLPGVTHWQHPRFFAYFATTGSEPGILAELLAATLNSVGFLWRTAPASTELELLVCDWVAQLIGLPDGFKGVIQDSASGATLAALVTAREKALAWAGNKEGLAAHAPVRVYGSTHTHSSIDKAVRIAGIGDANLVKIPVSGSHYGMDMAALDAAITADRMAGRIPAAIVACLGGTSVGACDDIDAAADIAARHGLYLHVDAAWAGSAMICPEFRGLMRGAERADSFVFNPHKWLLTNFDCSAHFIRDAKALTDTLGLRPAYLRTLAQEGQVDYQEWSVPLGRRFRALKLWFVIRSYGVAALQAKIRDHVSWARELAALIDAHESFELTSAPLLSLFSFRYAPREAADLDALNARLVERINDDGRIYLTQSQHEGRFVIRFQVGQTNTSRADVMAAWDVIREIAAQL